MTTALPAPATPSDAPLPDVRRLRLVGDTAPAGEDGNGSAPLVGYLVLVPEGTDPAQLFAKDVALPEIRRIACTASPPVQQAGGDAVRIDLARHVAELDGGALDLTYLEFGLPAHLVRHPHQVHSREQLMVAIWDHAHIGDGRTVDVHVSRLRRKLGTAHRHRIVTVRSAGYTYVPEQQESPRTARCRRP